MDIYGRGPIGQAWQYTGDVDSMPSWVKSSPNHHIEVVRKGTIYLWRGNEGMLVENGDWFVLSYPNIILLYTDDVFKRNFTFSDPSHCETSSVFSQKYRSKPTTVDAWQYTGELHFSELPCWISDLILHHKLGYHLTSPDKELFQFFYEDVWVPILKGDWLVRYGKDYFGILSDTDFKEGFEQIE